MTDRINVTITDNDTEFSSDCLHELEKLGLNAEATAWNGEEALKAIECYSPDAAVLDVCMPNIDAAEVIRVSKLQGTDTIFIATDCTHCECARKTVIQAGASYYIAKPFKAEVLCKRIGDILKIEQGTASDQLSSIHDIDDIIAEDFRKLGIPAHIKGYSYLRYAIILTVTNPRIIDKMVRSLYPAVAEEFSTTSSKVERAMRHAITIAWDRGSLDFIDKTFGYSVNEAKGKPTNSEFIATMADVIRRSSEKQLANAVSERNRR